MAKDTMLDRAITLIKELREDAELALSGAWDRTDKGFKAQIENIDEFLYSLEKKEPKGPLKQSKLF